MKLDFEQRSGLSFDDVRIHYNSDKPSGFHTDAYTYGTDVYIAPGQSSVLRHELGHVIQQKRGVRRHDSTENGVPVSSAPEIEKQADEFGWSSLPNVRPELLRQSGNTLPVVMKAPIKKRKYKTVRFPEMLPFFQQQRNSTWKPGRRSRTAFGIAHGNYNQGPHVYPFILWEVLAHAFNDAKVGLKELVGTRLIPYPKTARKIMITLAENAREKGMITKAEFEETINKFYSSYLRLYRKGQWRKLMELHPLHTYSLFRPVSQEEMQGKGERRTVAVDEIVDKSKSISFDLQGESGYVLEKIKKQGDMIKKLPVDSSCDVDLSADSEYSSGDSDVSDGP